MESGTTFKIAKLPEITKGNKREYEFTCFSNSYFIFATQTFCDFMT